MVDKLHYVHSRGGKIGLGVDTSAADVDAIVTRFCNDPRGHLVLHFHGGLVSKASGLAIADTLMPVYSPSDSEGGYPVFFVWESGALETIRNNLLELRDESVFKHLVRKALQYTLEHLGGRSGDGTRALPSANYGAYETVTKAEIDTYWADPSPENVPFRNLDVDAHEPGARAAPEQVDEDSVRADLETDVALQNALATLPVGTGARATGPSGVGRSSKFSRMAESVLATPLSGGLDRSTRGIVSLVMVAKYLVRVVRGVLGRHRSGRDHGLYATCVEEAIRAFVFLGSPGNEWAKALEWNRMKQDTSDAFGADSDLWAGTALLDRLGRAIAGGCQLKKITLVGHSTGAIYIARWLEHSKEFLPDTLRQDIVLLAPAITYELLAATLAEHGDRVGRVRLFAMQDELERQDQVWGADEALKEGKDWRRFIYPSSLLYLVSGILESIARADGTLVDEPDMPLVGMQRFFANKEVYPDEQFASIGQVRAWIAKDPRTLVWSKTTQAVDGGNCASSDHGAFDNDPATLKSLTYIVGKGF